MTYPTCFTGSSRQKKLIWACLVLNVLNILLLLGIQNSYAESCTFDVLPPRPAVCGEFTPGDSHWSGAGIVNRLRLKYDKSLQQFVIDATFRKCKSTDVFPNGFFGVFNAGPNPNGVAGELAILFADYRNPKKPILNLFGYTGDTNSWFDGVRNTDHNGIPGMPGLQPPDRIASSLSGDPILVSSSVTDTGNLRRILLVFSVKEANEHVPLYPIPGIPWTGMEISDTVGVWFHPFILTDETVYCTPGDTGLPCRLEANGISSVGYLKSWVSRKKGYYDQGDLRGNCSPLCSSEVMGATYDQTEMCYQMKSFEELMASFGFEDPEGNRFRVSHTSTLPGSPMITPVSGTEFVERGSVDVKWTAPDLVDPMRYSVHVEALDQHGAPERCSMEICVEPDPDNRPKTACALKVVQPGPGRCQGLSHDLSFSAADSTAADGGALNFEWSTDCASGTMNPQSPNSPNATLTLTNPGVGIGVDGCFVEVKVTDSQQLMQSCKYPIEVGACPIDCNGVPYGPAVFDQCNVCGGDGTSCLDCNGVPNGPAVMDICGVCGGDGSTCAQFCKSGFDACGVCGGDGSTCADCAGTPNGTAVLDQCGVCGGDGTSCLDCNGTVNGTAVNDVCGICGGDGSSCLDCNGVPNGAATIDQCGVCGGDNTSCVECQSTDISPFQREGDVDATQIDRVLRLEVLNPTLNLSRRLQSKLTKRMRTWRDKQLDALQTLRETAWSAIWTPEALVLTCNGAASVFCSSEDLGASISEFQKALEGQQSQAKELTTRFRRTLVRYLTQKKGLTVKRARRLAVRRVQKVLRTVEDLQSSALQSVESIPMTHSECDFPS